MFSNLGGGKKTFSFSVEEDEDGYIDRGCPGEECRFQFKVLTIDWTKFFRDEAVFCPMCGKSSSADSFFTTEQVEQAKKQVLDYYEVELTRHLSQMAHDFDRSQPQNSLIRVSMEVKGPKWHKPLIPLKANKELQLKIECDKCGAHFAVLGSAFFCPCCGHSSAVRVFKHSMTKIEAKVSHMERIRQAVAEVSEDEAEVTCRSLLESGLSDGVVAFQRVCEELYSQHPSAEPKLPINVFQRLADGSGLWEKLVGKGYSHFLSSREMDRLQMLFQRRHLLAHREGIVDQRYIDMSGDTTYAVGQRIVVREQDVLDMVLIIKKLVSGYLKELGYAS